MAKYVMSDGFEFVTDAESRIIASKKPRQRRYQREDLPIYIQDSPHIGDHLKIKGEGAPPSTSPTRIISIDTDFVL